VPHFALKKASVRTIMMKSDNAIMKSEGSPRKKKKVDEVDEDEEINAEGEEERASTASTQAAATGLSLLMMSEAPYNRHICSQREC
jgi:hypothetical protein